MLSETFQLIILVGAYVLTILTILACGAIALSNYRSNLKRQTSEEATTRISALELEQTALRGIVTKLNNRVTKGQADSKRSSTSDSPDPEGFPNDLERLFR